MIFARLSPATTVDTTREMEYLTEWVEAFRGLFPDSIGGRHVGGVVAILLLTCIFLLLRWIGKRTAISLTTRILNAKGSRIHRLRFQKQEILSAEEIVAILLGTLRIGSKLALLAMVFVFLASVCIFYPGTQGLADRLFNFLASTFALVFNVIVGYLPNLVIIAIVIVLRRQDHSNDLPRDRAKPYPHTGIL